MTSPEAFRAFRIRSEGESHAAAVEKLAMDDLAPGEVVIRTAFSSVNYKDALAGTGTGKILRRPKLVGDIVAHERRENDGA